jgi:hypothetical protein
LLVTQRFQTFCPRSSGSPHSLKTRRSRVVHHELLGVFFCSLVTPICAEVLLFSNGAELLLFSNRRPS